MASKVNSKFVLFLVVAIGVGAMLIGGLYALNMRGNAKRNYRIGQEALAAGDLQRARDYIGRAVYKEPGNLQYLADLETATLGERPKTAQEAVELYASYIKILQHGARHDAADADRHLRLLNELTNVARRSGGQWDMVGKSAQEMWEGLSPNDPARPLAKVYKSMATFRRVTISTFEEITTAEQEIKDAVEKLKDNDFAWATLITGEMVLTQKLREQGRSGNVVDQQVAAVNKSVADAVAAVPNGPEVARMALLNLLIQRSEKPDAANEAEISAAADHLVKVLPDDANIGLLNESAELLSIVPKIGAPLAEGVRERFMEKRPQDDDNRLSLAMLYFTDDKLDEARKLADQVIEAEPAPVGFLSQLQPSLRKQASGLIVDIEGRHWANATPTDRDQYIANMETERKRLSKLVSDENDVVLRKADARIAFSKNDFAKATELYERLVRETALGKDAETLYYSAYCLERLNQPGGALERVSQALELAPGNVPLAMMKARLELNMGRRTDAVATLSALPNGVQQTEEFKRLLAAAQNNDLPAGVEGAENSAIVLSNANVALAKGDTEGAMNIVSKALVTMPDNLPLLNSMIGLQLRAGKSDLAREYLERARKIDPQNVTVMQFDAALKYDDPVDALTAFCNAAIPNESDRVLAMATSLRAVALQQSLRALQLEKKDSEGAAKAKAISDRAKSEMQKNVARATQLMADDPRLTDLQFNIALDNRDWKAAEQMLVRAKAIDADQADGNLLKGRMHLTRAAYEMTQGDAQAARNDYQEAVRSLEKASNRLGFSSVVWRALAFAYQGLGNYSQAASAFEKAYRSNPNDLECVRSYANLLREQGEEPHALELMRAAHNLVPNDPGIKHMWLFLEDRVGDRLLALRTRRQMFKDNPNDTLNGSELARILNDLTPTQNTIVDDQGKPLYSDQRWSRMTPEEREQAMLRAKNDWYKESDSVLDAIAKNIGDDLSMVVMRASMLRERGSVVAGEELLQKYIAGKAEKDVTAEMYLELGRYQVRSVHYSDAIKTFEKALPLQNAETRDIDRELADLNMRLRRFDVALKHLQAILAVKPERALQNQAVECLLQLKRFDESQQMLDQIKTQHGEDIMCMLLEASIQEGRGDDLLAKGNDAGAQQQYLKQRDMLARAQVQEPTNIKPRILMAQSYLSEFERTKDKTVLEDALHVLDEADKVRAGDADVSMLRAGIYKLKGDASAAIGELRRLLDRQPDHQSARRELVQLYYDNRQGDAALATVDEAIRNNPTLSVWYDAKGDLCKLIKADPSAALAAYTQAYELAPSATGLAKIADATFATANPDCRALATRILAREQDLQSMAFLREALAKSMACMNMRDEALKELRLAYARRREVIKDNLVAANEISAWFNAVAYVFAGQDGKKVDVPAAESFILQQCNGSPDLYELVNLAKLWTAAGDPKLTRTIEIQRKAIDQCPNDQRDLKIPLYADLASYLGSVRSFEDAAAAYDAILKIDPNNFQAANNIAYVLAVEVKDVKRAVPYAELAMKLAPDNASVLDTVGWVQFLAGDSAKAVKTLQSAIEIQKSPVIHLHLAEAQIAAGDLNAAQQNVDDAFRMDQDGQSRQEIDRLNKVIREKRS